MYSHSTQRNDEEIQTAIRNMFLGVAPEREEELKQFWDRYQLRFNLLADNSLDGSFIMDAGAYRDIRFNHRALRAFWVATFAAWEGYRACSEGETDLTNFKSLISCVRAIMNADNPILVPLPNGIPEPGVFVEAEGNPQGRAAAELAVFASGWALMHEVRHIQHQQDGSSASIDAASEDKHKEEASCDEYATNFILEHVDNYAREQGVELRLVEQKRQAGIHFAMFALVIMSENQWKETISHPSMQNRINSSWKQMDALGLNLIAALVSVGAFYTLKQLWPDAPCPPVLSVSIG